MFGLVTGAAKYGSFAFTERMSSEQHISSIGPPQWVTDPNQPLPNVHPVWALQFIFLTTGSALSTDFLKLHPWMRWGNSVKFSFKWVISFFNTVLVMHCRFGSQLCFLMWDAWKRKGEGEKNNTHHTTPWCPSKSLRYQQEPAWLFHAPQAVLQVLLATRTAFDLVFSFHLLFRNSTFLALT